MAPQPLKSKSFLLACFSALLLLPAGAMPLMETTEARYAEIAREMIVSGNYLEPYFNAIKHFHKPPLAYWLVAAGLKTFGFNNFGARFFGILAAIAAVIYVYRCACLFLDKDRGALTAAIIFASSLLFLTVARLASTEIYLVACVVAAQFYLLRQIYGQPGRSNALWFGLWLGMGFMIKGPIIFLFTLLPGLVAKVIDKRHRDIFSWRQTLAACGIFCAVALPWYLLVIAKNPGLLAYFLKVQTIDRVVTDRFRRYEPPWYFFYIFAATFFPYILFFGKGLWRWKKLSSELKTLLLYVALPMLIFTIAKGKHATYILPFYGSCAILTAAMLNRDPMPRLRDATAAILLVFAAAPAIAGVAYAPLRSNMAPLLGSTLVLLALWWIVWKSRQRETFWTGTALLMLLFSTVAIVSVGIAGPNMRGYQQMAAAMNRIDPQKKLTTLIYHGFLPSVSFYRNQLAVMSFSDQRETQFQPEASYRPWYVTTESDLTPILAENPKLFVVVRKQKIENFTTQHAYRCSPIFQQRKHSAYLCQASPP